MISSISLLLYTISNLLFVRTDLRLIQAKNLLNGIPIRQRGRRVRGHCLPEKNDET